MLPGFLGGSSQICFYMSWDVRFWIGASRLISNRYRIQSKIVVIWITGWQGSTRLSGMTLDSVFWKGVSRPISNRYRIESKNSCCLDYWVAGSSQTFFYMSFGCEILDRSFHTDIKPIQNPKQKLLLMGLLGCRERSDSLL